MVDDADLVFLGRDCELSDVPDVKRIKPRWFRAAIARVDFNGFFAAGIGERDDAFSIVQPLREAVARAISLSVLEDSPFPIRHRKGFAADRQR